tara:strand:+ start:1128 stop:2045 length:918 start_codon:yes stop_codon:yes gene_type:complete
MARKDLLSEAIADAKAVKETAMANAKLALEEAFTPKLQSMISAKLAEEAEEEMEEDETEEAYHSEEAEVEEYKEAEMDSEEEMEEAEMDSEEEVEMEEEEEMEMDSEEDEDELDLESIIRELEDENEMGSEEEMEMTEEEDVDEEEDMDEEEEIDLDEVIRTLKEMEDSEEEVSEEEDMDEEEDEDMAGELEEAYTTIKSLQTTINEVNLLNAKLLYTNKLFRTFDLNENQKVKVLENFDRTSSVREVKLVFSTLAENLNVAKKTKVVVREGYASKATKSSAPKKKIISEGNELAARWKKLAGLI